MSFLGSQSDTKEIVLFFKNGVKYDTLALAKELVSRYPNLGDAIIPSEAETGGIPLVYFSDDKDMLISADNRSVAINITEKYFKDVASIIFDIADAFNEYGVELVRIGYITNIYMTSNKIDRVKSRFLIQDNLENIEEFNLAWYRKFKASFGSINCWERFITERGEESYLIAQYDFNTVVDNKFDFELKSIKEFINTADDYIEGRVNSL